MYSGYWPAADLAKRFGYSSCISGEVGYKFRSGLYLTFQGGGLFGDKIVEPGFLQGMYIGSLEQVGVLSFMDESGRIFSISVRQRGWQAQTRIGWILRALRLPWQNPNCGPFVEIGGGYLSHRIHIDKARSDKLPLLEGEYLKGLDRLTGGWGLCQAVGYRFFSNKGLINFFIAIEAGQYYTRSLRGYLYDVGRPDRDRRRDFWYGFRIGWSLPLYEKAPLE